MIIRTKPNKTIFNFHTRWPGLFPLWGIYLTDTPSGGWKICIPWVINCYHHHITIIATIIISIVVIIDINIIFNMTAIVFINNIPKKAALGNCVPTDAGQPPIWDTGETKGHRAGSMGKMASEVSLKPRFWRSHSLVFVGPRSVRR